MRNVCFHMNDFFWPINDKPPPFPSPSLHGEVIMSVKCVGRLQHPDERPLLFLKGTGGGGCRKKFTNIGGPTDFLGVVTSNIGSRLCVL